MIKNSPANAGDANSIPSSGRSSGERNVDLLPYSCLLNLMDGGAYGLKSMGSQRDSVTKQEQTMLLWWSYDQGSPKCKNSSQDIAMAPHKVSGRNIWQRKSA